MKGLLIQLKQSALFLSILTLVSSLVYIIVSLNRTYTTFDIESDNLDYILPCILIIIVFYNFKYYYIKEEAYYYKSLPITFKKVFINKYLLSIIHTLFVYTVLLIVTGILVIYSDRSLLNFNYVLYFISLILKFGICVLLNTCIIYVLIRFKSFKNIISVLSLLYIIWSILNCIIFLMFNYLEIYPIENIFIILNILIGFTNAVYNFDIGANVNGYTFFITITFIIPIIVLVILSFITFKQNKNIKLEDFK